MARRAITELHHSERRTLMLLRGSTIGESNEGVALFDALQLESRRHGLIISQPGMRQASGDEVLLLGWLSVLQRWHSVMPAGLSVPLGAALMRCAAWLRDAAIKLPQRAIGRVDLIEVPASLIEAMPTRPAPRPRHSSARVRARALIAGRDVVSASDFAASGISRQCLSNWCRDGLLERVSTGWYRPRPSLMAA